MDAPLAAEALAACRRVADGHGLDNERAMVLQDSNRLTIHLLPADVITRVAPASKRSIAESEVAIAALLDAADAPVAGPDPRVPAAVYDDSGFAVTFWAHHPPISHDPPRADEYALALARLHHAMRSIDAPPGLGHVSDRVAQATSAVDGAPDDLPISTSDLDLVRSILDDARSMSSTHAETDQLIHGEPHPGNLIRTRAGPLFIDFETCCRGPIEFDIAHATADGSPPSDVAEHYPGADVELVREHWRLTLALAVAWRLELGDDLPDGPARAREWVRQLRSTLD